MKRFKKILLRSLIVIAVLLVAGMFGMRWSGSKHEPVEAVAGAENVYRIRNMIVDFYAAKTSDGVILFDAGVDVTGGPLDALLAKANANDPKRDQVKTVFVTHGHTDHIAAISLLPQAKVYASAEDAATMQGQGANQRPMPKILGKIFGVPPVNATDLLKGRSEIPVGDGREKVLAIPFPGHTPGSYLYVFRGVLFVGDAFNFSNERLEFPPNVVTEDMGAVRLSIAQLPKLLEGVEVKIICTGHGGCTYPENTAALLDQLVAQAQAAFN